MARRLFYHNLILGVALTTTTADLVSVCAQSAQQDTATKINGEKAGDKPQDKSPPENKDHRDDRRDDKRGERRDDGRGGEGRGGEGRRDGRGPGFNGDSILEMMKRNPGFIQEVVKRDGGPLELLAPLMKPEVREAIALDPAHAAAADKFLAEMTSRFEEDIKAHKDEANADWEKLFSERLKVENAQFEEFLNKQLPADKLERLLGIFVQYRNMRALGNRVVADKVGMTPEESDKLRQDIHRVRMETIRENDDWARRRIESGNTVQQADQLRKVRAKIDDRIEKLVKKEHLQKLQSMRGTELPPELLETLDRPPAPPKRN